MLLLLLLREMCIRNNTSFYQKKKKIEDNIWAINIDGTPTLFVIVKELVQTRKDRVWYNSHTE